MCKEGDAKLKRMAALLGMATMKNVECEERIAALEETVQRLNADKAMLLAEQHAIDIEPEEIARHDDNKPGTRQRAGDQETVRIFRSQTPKGENPAFAER